MNAHIEQDPPLSPSRRTQPEQVESEEPLISSASSQSERKYVPNNKTRQYRWHIICIAIHVFFVALHLVLIAVMQLGVEKRVLIGLGTPTTVWGTAIQIILQAFAISSLACALFISQKLFLRRMLLSQQTLTLSHDQYESWLGLGGAINTLFMQRAPWSGVSSLFPIALYLGASAVMKTSTSALFELSTISILSSTIATANSPVPFLDSYSDADNSAADPFFSTKTQRLHSVLMQAYLMDESSSFATSLISSIGLAGNTLYDVIPQVANATGQAEVNTYSVNATCYSVPEANYHSSKNPYDFGIALLSDPVNNRGHIDNDTIILPVLSLLNISDSTGTRGNQLPISALNFARRDGNVVSDSAVNTDVMVSFDQPQDQDTYDPWVDNGISIARPFTCAKGLRVNVFGVTSGGTWIGTPFQGVSLMFCSIQLVQGKGMVDAQQRTLVTPLPRRNSSAWTEFPHINAGNISDSFTDTVFDIGSDWNTGQAQESMSFGFRCNETQPADSDLTWVDLNGESSSRSSIFESAIIQMSGIFNGTATNSAEGDPLPQITLHGLENALEDYVALYRFTRIKANELLSGANANTTHANVQVPVNELVSQLTLRALPVYLGLSAACVMLAVAAWITLTTPLYISPLESVGMLQLLWLSAAGLFHVSSPTQDELRKAGRETSVRLGDGVGLLGKHVG